MNTKVLGLDISKASACYCILEHVPNDPKRFVRTQKLRSIKNTEAGRKELLGLDFSYAVLEPTGVYSRIFRHWLRSAGREYRMVGHSDLAHYRNGWGLQKTDKMDAMALAMYGLERQSRPSSWLTERDYEFSDEVLFLAHLNQQKNGYQNNLRQKLIWQMPELYDKDFRRKWNQQSIPGILEAIAGNPSKSWTKKMAATTGQGLGNDSRRLGRILIAIEKEEIETEQSILRKLGESQFAPYLSAASRCEFSIYLTIHLIAAVYPFEQFLDAGHRRISRRETANGNRASRDESMRAFKLACGMGLVFHQSGDMNKWVAGGSGDCRSALHNSISMEFLRLKKEKNPELSELELEIKSTYDKQGIMRFARKWVEQFYRELWNEQSWV